MFDLMKQVVESKRIHSIDPKGNVVRQQIDDLGADHLSQVLYSSKRMEVSSSAISLIIDMMDSAKLLRERINQLHMAYDQIIFNVPEQNLAIQLQNINEHFEVELFQLFPNVDKLNLKFSSFKTIIEPHNNSVWTSNNRLDRIKLLFDRDFRGSEYNDIRLCYPELFKEGHSENESVAICDVLSHTYITPNNSHYFAKGNTSRLINDFYNLGINDSFEKGMFNGLGHDISRVISATYFAVAALTFLDLHSYLPIRWTYNVHKTKGGKRGVSHSIIDIDINAKQYLPKPKEEKKEEDESGIKRRHHEVRGSRCISHRTGKSECKDICVPMEIDERRIKCLQCGKKGWLRKNHERGDKSLGSVTKEYKVIAS